MVDIPRHIRGTLFNRRPYLERVLCHFAAGNRLKLPGIYIDKYFDEFDNQPFTLTKLPYGLWSTPLEDLIVLLKVVVCSQPQKLLELGSFRGYTALSWAENIGASSRIVTVDIDPKHGEAYLGTPFDKMIERRIGNISSELFASDAPASFDLIFVDASHDYESVKAHTLAVLHLLRPDGFILWHDYANYGKFSKFNGVPEFLHELAQNLPIAHIIGTNLAIHSPSWSNTAAGRYSDSLGTQNIRGETDPWASTQFRGQY